MEFLVKMETSCQKPRTGLENSSLVKLELEESWSALFLYFLYHHLLSTSLMHPGNNILLDSQNNNLKLSFTVKGFTINLSIESSVGIKVFQFIIMVEAYNFSGISFY